MVSCARDSEPPERGHRQPVPSVSPSDLTHSDNGMYWPWPLDRVDDETDDGAECSFRGTYLEVEPPTRTVETWVFEGPPRQEAVETTELREARGVTKLTIRSAYSDREAATKPSKADSTVSETASDRWKIS